MDLSARGTQAGFSLWPDLLQVGERRSQAGAPGQGASKVRLGPGFHTPRVGSLQRKGRKQGVQGVLAGAGVGRDGGMCGERQ